jgi:hypothetical protein
LFKKLRSLKSGRELKKFLIEKAAASSVKINSGQSEVLVIKMKLWRRSQRAVEINDVVCNCNAMSSNKDKKERWWISRSIYCMKDEKLSKTLR